MNVTQRGQIGPEDEALLDEAMMIWKRTEQARIDVRTVVVEVVRNSSYREVARLTGFSTNTLQRWVREAGR